MPENLLGMQLSNFRYANMDFFQNTTYSNKISEGKNQYSNMNFWCFLVTPVIKWCLLYIVNCEAIFQVNTRCIYLQGRSFFPFKRISARAAGLNVSESMIDSLSKNQSCKVPVWEVRQHTYTKFSRFLFSLGGDGPWGCKQWNRLASVKSTQQQLLLAWTDTKQV